MLGNVSSSNDVFSFSFESASNASFTVFSTTNLSSPWTILNVPVTQIPPDHFQFSDTNSANQQQFYQIRSP